MIRLFLIGLTALYGVAAFPYGEGRYACKNKSHGIPDDIYVIKKVLVGIDGDKLPYIQATRFFRKEINNPNSEVVSASVAGLATVFSSEVSPEILAIGAIRLEFSGDEMVGCIK